MRYCTTRTEGGAGATVVPVGGGSGTALALGVVSVLTAADGVGTV